MFLKIVLASLVVLSFGCTPPCDATITPAPLQQVCHRADSGVIAADTSFTLEGSTFLQSASCRVVVDGGQLSLFADGTVACADNRASVAERAAPLPLRCAIPALPAGTYSVNSSPVLTFTLPESADAGVPSCQ